MNTKTAIALAAFSSACFVGTGFFFGLGYKNNKDWDARQKAVAKEAQAQVDFRKDVATIRQLIIREEQKADAADAEIQKNLQESRQAKAKAAALRAFVESIDLE